MALQAFHLSSGAQVVPGTEVFHVASGDGYVYVRPHRAGTVMLREHKWAGATHEHPAADFGIEVRAVRPSDPMNAQGELAVIAGAEALARAHGRDALADDLARFLTWLAEQPQAVQASLT